MYRTIRQNTWYSVGIHANHFYEGALIRAARRWKSLLVRHLFFRELITNDTLWPRSGSIVIVQLIVSDDANSRSRNLSS